MSRIKRSTLGLTAGVLALLAVGTDIASASVIGAAPAVQQAGANREVHIAVTNIYVHNDADAGARGCGDFRDGFGLEVNGVDRLRFDNGTKWRNPPGLDTFGPGGRGWQDYCSDHNYPMNIYTTGNRYIGSAPVGKNLKLIGEAIEQDGGDDTTEGWGLRNVLVPPIGTYTDQILMIEGSNSNGAMRLEVTIRVRTF